MAIKVGGHSFPTRPLLWSWPLLAAAILLAVGWQGGTGPLGAPQVLLAALLGTLTVAAELAPVRVAPHQKASLASVPLLLAGLLLPPVVGALLAGTAIMIGNLGAGRRPLNASFNASTAAIAVLLTGLVASPIGLNPRSLAAGVIGCALFSILSLAAPATATAIQRSEPVPKRIQATIAANWSQALAFDAIALSIAALGMAAPLAAPIPLLFLPLVFRMNVALEGQLAANESLGRVLAAQRRFLTDVSHNVGNPLATIRMNLSLLQTLPLRPNHETALEDARAEAVRLSLLFQRLRVLAETDEDLPLTRGRLDLADMAGELVRAYTGEAGSRGVTLTSESTTATEVDADEDLLRQAAANLIENALRLTPRGKSVRLRVSSVDRLACLEVIDEGPGIDPDLLPDIFNRFKKGPDGGSGLGLAIARSVVERHGGQIRVESTLGSGARFEIWLPAAAAGQSTASA